MFTLSAFADEIGPDPREQIAVLKACNVITSSSGRSTRPTSSP